VIFERVLLAGSLGSLGIAAWDLPATGALVEALVAGCLALALAATLFVALRLYYRLVLRADYTPLGFGDVLLTSTIGTMLGRDAVWALIVGIGLAGAATLAAMVAGRIRRHDPIPLGSFLSWGALIVLLCR
jgi:prepilin signal peptidase PulO-like enzyme (type II secretory pathway)